MESTKDYRSFIKADLWEEWERLDTDQRRRVPPPPLQKPPLEEAVLINLVAPKDYKIGKMPLLEAISRRRSRRSFTQQPLSLEELSFLLWTTQGMSVLRSGEDEVNWKGKTHLRTAPSAGARHPFETYLLVRRVEGIKPGLYRYLPLDHKLLYTEAASALREREASAWGGRNLLTESAVVFLWAAIPYRTEWRYNILSPRLIALDAGHVCQNLYLACEAIGAGVCAVAAFDQKRVDALAGVDGEDEFVVYLAPVGKVAAR